MSAPGALDAYAGWRRLDLKMLLVHPVRETVRFIPALVAIFVLGHRNHDSAWELLGVGIPVALGLLRWATTSYRIENGQIELRRGLIQRSTITARLDRVRTVELTSSLIHRALGLAKVEIGTGSTGRSHDGKLELDALAIAPARALRAQLLHRTAVPAAVGHAVPTVDAGREHPVPDQHVSDPVAVDPPDDVLVRLDPAWARYAPLTTSGLVIALGALGVSGQVIGQAIDRVAHDGGVQRIGNLPLAVVVPVAVLLLLAAISVLAIAGYILANFGFTLSRDPAGRTFHIRQGLLTTRETSIDAERLRGLEIHEPLGLRLAGGGRLTAIVTGLDRKERNRNALVPPAPRSVVERVGETVLGEAGPFTVRLLAHGPRARRRRYNRALGGAAVLAAALVGLVFAGVSAWVLLAVPVLAVGAVALARDRYAGLGHALLDDYVVTRRGSFRGRRDALQRTGIIGWNLDQTFFQRRVGLCTLTATTAAGQQGYCIQDVPQEVAVALADQCSPGLFTDFLVHRNDDLEV